MDYELKFSVWYATLLDNFQGQFDSNTLFILRAKSSDLELQLDANSVNDAVLSGGVDFNVCVKKSLSEVEHRVFSLPPSGVLI